MSNVAFDTLQFAKRLESGGFNTKQAEALAAAQKDAMHQSGIELG